MSNLQNTQNTQKTFNPYDPLKLYQDFEFEEDGEIINEENYSKNLMESTNENQYKKTNTFRYESFADRIKKIKVKLSTNTSNDISFLKTQEKEGFKVKSNDTESNFLTMLHRERIVNTSDEFKNLEGLLSKYTESYLIFINNSEKIMGILSQKLNEQVTEKVKNFPFIISLLEIICGLIKDLRDETYNEFLDKIFPNVIKLLSETQNIEVIENTFGVLVNIFKFLQNAIMKQRNFTNFFYLFSELIFSKVKYIRKFTCESISYLIKNVTDDKLNDIIQIILSPFIEYQKFFDTAAMTPKEKNNCDTNIPIENFQEIFSQKIFSFKKNLQNYSNKEKGKEGKEAGNTLLKNNRFFPNFLQEAILNFEYEIFNKKNSFTKSEIEKFNETLHIKIFLIECLSDFFVEILIGINKDISIKADLFLEKLFLKKNEKLNSSKNSNNVDYLNFIIDISVTFSFIKLFSKLKNEKKSSIFSLLNFYLLKKLNLQKEIKFQKLKTEKISQQLNYFENEKNEKMEKMEKNEKNEKNEKMEIDDFNRNFYEKNKIFILLNFFLLELFVKNYMKFDTEIIKFYFDFLKKFLENKKDSVFSYTISTNKDDNSEKFFWENLKLDLFTLLIKFFPNEFTEAFKFDFFSLNGFNKITDTIDFNEKDNFYFKKILEIFDEKIVDNTEENSDLIEVNLLNLFLEKLRNLQNLKFFKGISFTEIREILIVKELENSHRENLELNSAENLQIEKFSSKNPYINNDDYNNDYDGDLLNKLFSLILNFFNYKKIENILEIKTTYDILLAKSKNEEENFPKISDNNLGILSSATGNHIPLIIMNSLNLNLLVNFIKNFDTKVYKNFEEKGKSATSDKDMKFYIDIYSLLIIGDLTIKSFFSLKNLNTIRHKNLPKEKNSENFHTKILINLIEKNEEIYQSYIEKALELILFFFESNEKNEKNSFSQKILKIKKPEEEILFNILFREFNDIKTFYVDKKTAFLNLLEKFTENFLIFNKEKNNQKNSETQKFYLRILSILFSHSENGSTFKTFNSLIKFAFDGNFEEFLNFCEFNKIFFPRKFAILQNFDFLLGKNLEENLLQVNSLEEFLIIYSPIFYSSCMNIKKEFFLFLRNWMKIKKIENFKIKGIEDIFDLMNYILNLEYEISNDKKYSLNFEVLISKLELVNLDSENKGGLLIFGLIFDFLIGSYWIRLTKTLWPILTKCVQRFFEICENLKNFDLNKLLFSNSIKVFRFIHQIGSIDSIMENFDTKIFKEFYFVFTEKFEENFEVSNKSTNFFDADADGNNPHDKELNYSFVENIVKLSFYGKRDDVSTLALSADLFYEGFLKSSHNFEIVFNSFFDQLLEKSEKKLENEGDNKNIFDDFYFFAMEVINPKSEKWYNTLSNENDNNKENFICNKNDKFFLNFFNNFIIEKETKKYFGIININLQESILTILSKVHFNKIFKVKNFEEIFEIKKNIKNVLFNQIIFCRTMTTQKLCIEIYLNLEPKLKKYSKLFEKLIENSNLIDRLYNLDDIRTDGNEKISKDERDLLIPIVIRLYYSKYFYISNKNKKVKTRNKINIVSFFIQLKNEEFEDYVKVLLRPLMIFEEMETCEYPDFHKGILFAENPQKSFNFFESYFNSIENSNNITEKFDNFEAIRFLDLKIYRKILEIIALNLKQITTLYESSVDFFGIFIMNILIFIRKINNFYSSFHEYKKQTKILISEDKENKQNNYDNENDIELAYNKKTKRNNSNNPIEEIDEILNNFQNSLLNNPKIKNSKFINYFDKEKILDFSILYFKLIKDIKKTSFGILKTIFSKFSYKENLIHLVSNSLFTEYSNVYKFLQTTENLQMNTLLNFTFNIAKNPMMHFTFIKNPKIFFYICEIFSNNFLDNKFLNSLLEFFEDIIFPYSDYKTKLISGNFKNFKKNGKNLSEEYLELGKVNRQNNLAEISDEENFNSKKNSADFSQIKKRKLTTDSNLSFLNYEENKEENFGEENLSKNLVNKITEKTEKNLLTHEIFMENQRNLIQENFKIMNKNLINLLSQGRLRLKLKDNLTERTINLLLELWNLFDIEDEFFLKYADEEQSLIENLLTLLVELIYNDSKIFKEDYDSYLFNILKLCNILIILNRNKLNFYLKFVHLIYRISNTQNRLICGLILKNININFITSEIENPEGDFKENNSSEFFDTDSLKVFDKIISLNLLNKKKTLENSDNMNTDDVLENLNSIESKFIAGLSIIQLEPLFYQIISLANFSEDFSIETVSITKVKILLDEILSNFANEIHNKKHKNQIETFLNILRVLLNLLNLVNYNKTSNKQANMTGDNYQSLGKIKQEKIKRNILDLFSYLNSKIQENEKLINQLNLFEKEKKTNNENDIDNFITIKMDYLFDKNSENFENFENSTLEIFGFLLCRDLFSIKTPDGEYDFFEGILNIKYEIRSLMLITLKQNLIQRKIKYFSLMNMIIPLVKSFLNFEVGKKKFEKKNNFEVFHKTKDSREIINSCIELIEPISQNLDKKDFLNFLMHFYRRISKANFQERSKNFDENKFSFEKLYEVFSRLLECLNFFKFDFITDVDFDTEFNRLMRDLITEYNSKGDLNIFTNEIQDNINNDISGENKIKKLDENKIKEKIKDKFYSKDLFSSCFHELYEIYERENKRNRTLREDLMEIDNYINNNNDNNYNEKDSLLKISEKNKTEKKKKFENFSNNLLKLIYNMLRSMLYDNYRKDKTKKYYIRNFVIQPFFTVLKKMDPRTLKYELISLVYEIVNNLKNKDLDCREKARHAIRILIETLGPFVTNIIFEQIKAQLISGYQRYVRGYTTYYVITILNKLYLTFNEIEELKNNDDSNKSQFFLEEISKKFNSKEKNPNEDIEMSLENNNNKENDLENDNNINIYENIDINFIQKFKSFTKKDIEKVFDFSLGLVIPLLLEEIFGEVAEEKEMESLVKRYKEGREIKAYPSFTIISSRLNFKSGILNLIFPIRSFIAEIGNNNSMINKINQIFTFVLKGLKENITMKIEDILLISYSLVNLGLEINLKNSKEIKQNKKITFKGSEINEEKFKINKDHRAQKNELVNLQFGNTKKTYSIEIAYKLIAEKNDIILMNLFTQFGLDLFLLAVKKKVFDFSGIKEKNENLRKNKNEENDDADFDNKFAISNELENYEEELFNEFVKKNKEENLTLFNGKKTNKLKDYYLNNKINYTEKQYKFIISQIEVLLFSVISCLKISSNNILAKSLKILTSLFDTRLFVIKKNLKKIGSNLFKNLGIITFNESDKNVAQTILSCFRELLTKFTFFEVSEHQMKLLINFLKIFINNLEMKSAIFSVLLAVVKRKFLHPCIYDMVDYIQETYLISFDEATKKLCEIILIEFLNNYPLDSKRRNKHINFFISNLESNSRNCVLNSLRIISKIVEYCLLDKENEKFLSEAIKDFIDFLVLKLLLLIGNSTDSDVKEISSRIIEDIFNSEKMITKEKYDIYLAKIINWIDIEKIGSKTNENDDEESEEIKKEITYSLNEKQKQYLKLGLNFLSILLNTPNTELIKTKFTKIFDIITINTKLEFNKFENQLENQIENRNYSKINSENNQKSKTDFDKIFSKDETQIELEEKKETNLNLIEEDVTILNIQLEDWDIYYLHLITIEKFMQKNSLLFKRKLQNDKEFANKILQSVKHPHIFIKTITMRFISEIFNEDKKFLNFENEKEANLFLLNLIKWDNNDNNKLNTLQIILDNFKFLILCKDFDLKENLIEMTLDVASYFNYLLLNLDMRNKSKGNFGDNFEFSVYAYQFICRLYGDSKKYLANKSYTNLYVRRILNVIEKIINFCEEKNKGKDFEILLEPVLSLLYRLISNNLVEDNIKVYSEKIVEMIKNKIDFSLFSTKYKEVRNEINMLRKKRKVDNMQTYITDQKKFYNEKKKNKH